MSEKCPICKTECKTDATVCSACGFTYEPKIAMAYPIPEDMRDWLDTVVKPYQAVWEARKREADDLRAQLEASRKQNEELLAQLEEAKKRKTESAESETFFTDPRDGQVYRTVKIGGLVWMAENLNYKTENSWCYDNDESNGKKYGRLYTWDAAKKACPKGWHLPSREEWDALVKAAGSESCKKLKSKTGWNDRKDGTSGNGTDEFGFSALPGGSRYSGGSFYNVGIYGDWWSASEYGSGDAYARYMYYDDDGVRENDGGKSHGFSVRCVAVAQD